MVDVITKRKAVKALEKGKPIQEILERFSVSEKTLFQWQREVEGNKEKEEDVKKDEKGLPDMDFRKLMGCG